MTDDLHHLAAAYALDALDGDELDAFEAHYPGCERCRDEVAEFHATAAVLAGAAAVPPPPSLREAVLAQVAETRQVPPQLDDRARRTGRRRDVRRGVRRDDRRRTWQTAPLLAAAALVAVIIGAAFVVGLRDGGASDLEELVTVGDSVTLPLAGDAGTVRVVWSSELGRAALIADGLAHPGEGRVYGLWAIADGTPVPAGLFTPDDGAIDDVVELAAPARQPAAWGVTIEPEGGSSAPTGDILFYAEV